MNILIIAGHGGSPYDPGACGCGQKEAVLTRDLANLLQIELGRISKVNPIMYNQNNDAYKILRNGGSLPLSGVTYVIELHFNAAANDLTGDGKTTGTEVLIHTSESGYTVENYICQNIAKLGFKNRGVKRRSDLLVMNTVRRKGISHALIEVCFVDDADDMKLYLAKKAQVAQAIAQGIATGFGLSVTWNPTVVTNTPAPVKETIPENDFKGLYNAVNPLYTSLAQVPDYWRDDVKKMIEIGAIKGDGKNAISIRHDALQATIIGYRLFRGENIL